MTPEDYAELQRLDGMGMKRVICDVSGQRGAVDDFGHFELIPEGLLMNVRPFSPMEIKDELRGKGYET